MVPSVGRATAPHQHALPGSYFLLMFSMIKAHGFFRGGSKDSRFRFLRIEVVPNRAAPQNSVSHGGGNSGWSQLSTGDFRWLTQKRKFYASRMIRRLRH
jgi:hypothetical protein